MFFRIVQENCTLSICL